MTQSYFSPRSVLEDIRALPGPLLRWLLILAAVYAVLFAADLTRMVSLASAGGEPNMLQTIVLAIAGAIISLGTPYAMARFAAEYERGRPLVLAAAMQGFTSRLLFPGILALLALNLVMLAVGLVLMSLPAAIGAPFHFAFLIGLTYAALRLICLIPVIAFENIGFLDAVRRSWAMTAGRVGRIFLSCLIVLLIIAGVGIAYFAILGVVGLPGLPTLDMTKAREVLAALTPAHIVAMSIFYGAIVALSWLLLPVVIYRLLRQEPPAGV